MRDLNTSKVRLLNTSLVFDRSGTEIARYRKIHLFDVILPDCFYSRCVRGRRNLATGC